MKKLQFVFLFVLMVGCSSAQETPPIDISNIRMPTSSQFPTQTAISPTQTSTPTFTPVPTMTFTSTPTPIGGGLGKIAFTSDRNGMPDIYIINSDGSNLVELTNEISPKYSPAWSPDGTKIAFASNSDDAAILYVMNSDGSNPVKLIDTKALEDQSSLIGRFETGCCSVNWSHDGKTLMLTTRYHSGCCRMLSDVYTINLDGSGTTKNEMDWLQISQLFGNWSPDGKKIVFEADNCGGAIGICVMNADGTNIINIAHARGYGGSDYGAIWSPDNTKVAFTSGRNGDREIFVVDVDGSNLVNITHYGAAWDGNPVWSPDGTKIAFNSYRDDNYEIYMMNADGSEQINLTNSPAYDGSMLWSPDATKIIFTSDRDGHTQIYMMDPDGSQLVQLTNGESNSYSPIWLQ